MLREQAGCLQRGCVQPHRGTAAGWRGRTPAQGIVNLVTGGGDQNKKRGQTVCVCETKQVNMVII